MEGIHSAPRADLQYTNACHTLLIPDLQVEAAHSLVL
jgi:hypothetical protein